MTTETDTRGGAALETLGDVRREMARVYRLMRSERLPIGTGNGLMNALNCLAALLIDHRDSLHKRRLAVLWKEREEAQKPQAQVTQ